MQKLALIAAGLTLVGANIYAQNPAAPDAARQKAPSGAKVFIVEPKDGATVSQDVTVKFGVSGIKLMPATDTMPGTGHHHLLIDNKELPALNAPIPNDATHKHYGKAQTEDTIRLEPGDHTLQLDFGDALHRQFDPPIVSKKITVHVK